MNEPSVIYYHYDLNGLDQVPSTAFNAALHEAFVQRWPGAIIDIAGVDHHPSAPAAWGEYHGEEVPAEEICRLTDEVFRQVVNEGTAKLLTYAEEQIKELNLGPNGPLGTEFVVAYDDAGPCRVRISDGHGEEICDSETTVDSALQSWVDWIKEGTTEEGEEECAYCGRLIPIESASVVPPPGDDEAWGVLSRDHAPECEWIQTRAHRVTCDKV